MDVKELANKYKDYTIALRREFHMYPEASWHEFNTSARIKKELETLNIPFVSPLETGIVATVSGKNPGKTVALRADIDALQVTEETQVPYQSKNPGLMHACGHDNHIAMLLCAGRILNDLKNELAGNVKLIFQPAEEAADGAKKMVETGALENVDSIFGIHVWSDVASGTVAIEPGPRMASTDMFKITVHGKGGHGSAPHQGIDAVVTASALVMNLQSAVSRELPPLEPSVISVGSLKAGSRFNVIASEAVLEGTTRTFNPDIRNKFPKIIERIAKDTAATYRAQAESEYTFGTPTVINDPHYAQLVAGSVKKLRGPEALSLLGPIMGGEDFAAYLEKVPGAIAFLGVGNAAVKANYPQHHPQYNVDENALELGAGLYAQVAIDMLKK